MRVYIIHIISFAKRQIFAQISRSRKFLGIFCNRVKLLGKNFHARIMNGFVSIHFFLFFFSHYNYRWSHMINLFNCLSRERKVLMCVLAGGEDSKWEAGVCVFAMFSCVCVGVCARACVRASIISLCLSICQCMRLYVCTCIFFSLGLYMYMWLFVCINARVVVVSACFHNKQSPFLRHRVSLNTCNRESMPLTFQRVAH